MFAVNGWFMLRVSHITMCSSSEETLLKTDSELQTQKLCTFSLYELLLISIILCPENVYYVSSFLSFDRSVCMSPGAYCRACMIT